MLSDSITYHTTDGSRKTPSKESVRKEMDGSLSSVPAHLDCCMTSKEPESSLSWDSSADVKWKHVIRCGSAAPSLSSYVPQIHRSSVPGVFCCQGSDRGKYSASRDASSTAVDHCTESSGLNTLEVSSSDGSKNGFHGTTEKTHRRRDPFCGFVPNWCTR